MNRVLLVDDNRSTREALQHHFAALGFSVMSVCCSDALRALDAAPDFVLLHGICNIDVTPKNAATWVYQLRDTSPHELRVSATAAPNENSLFWHRRLQRALMSSTLGIRTMPQNA